MSDEETPVEKPFAAERAKQGRAVCKKCKQKCLKGELRIAKLVANPFGDGKMKSWHHLNCLFEAFLKQRATTKRIEEPDDIDGWDALEEDDKEAILKQIEQSQSKFGVQSKAKQKTPKKDEKEPKTKNVVESVAGTSTSTSSSSSGKTNKDDLFKSFRRLIADISNVSSYTEKTNLVQKMFTEGSDGDKFKGDVVLWTRMLLPGVVKRVYNLQSRQLIKLFSRIFHYDQNNMFKHLEQGDIGETIQHFFEKSLKYKPAKKSLVTIQEVDDFLEALTQLTKEDDQITHFKNFGSKCTANDLKIIIRLIKHDLRMNAGAKHILDGIHPDAYQAYQASRDISTVIKRCLEGGSKKTKESTIKATIQVLTPVLPMLAEACKSVEYAMKKCTNGMYAEVKYDGERVQVHKCGSEFKYYSRSLKPVLPHKVRHFKEYIQKAFPHGKDLILDSEILMIDTNTGKPLPFGSLGKHKKTEFKDATVCLFVFDCIYYNGESLLDKPISHRKEVLQKNMQEIPNHIVYSEMEEIHQPDDLATMIAKVLKMGLEGLVLKDIGGFYEPGKRHWLKVKKDYLFGGAMADTADLIVLGAWYGTGKKGGMMSVFLMGSYDPYARNFCTVTKVHTGHDDKTLERLQNELDMIKISMDVDKVPDWLNCTKTMVPDFVAKNPKKQPVWEITGAEFTQIHEVHTAKGISIRFPRVTKIRHDKTWETATNVTELETLFKNSKEHTDVSLLTKGINKHDESSDDKNKKSPIKRKTGNSSKDSEETSPVKKQKTMDDFVKNSPKIESKKIKDATIKITNPLPDYFEGVKALLDFPVEDDPEFVRYLIAFGGTLLKSSECKENATHVFHLKRTVSKKTVETSLNVRHVVVDWVKDSASQAYLKDCNSYAVQWNP